MNIENGNNQNNNIEKKVIKKEGKEAKTEKAQENNRVSERIEDSSKEYVFPDKATISELVEKGCTLEQAETADYWLKVIEEEEKARTSKEKKECGPEIEELEKLFVSFETEHSLTELSLIIDANVAKGNLLRDSAKKALGPITKKLDVLKKETNISLEKYDELEAKYKMYSKAVGMINGGKVDHDR